MSLTILEAMDQPELFAPHFKGTSWDAWKAFLAALFALPLTDTQMATYQAHTGRTEPPAAPFTEATLVCGRRAGKSRTLALIACYLAAFRDYTPHLASGEKATVAVIAADRKQARSIFRFISGLLNDIEMLSSLVADERAESIELTNGVVIEIHTASFRVTRGLTFCAVLCDEVAYWRGSEENSAAPDSEIITAVRPGMATIPGAVLLMASSPYRRKGELYRSYARHYGKDGARVLVWQGSTASMNPKVDFRIIEEAYEEDPEGAASEYGALFRSDLSDLLARATVDAATPPGRIELPPRGGVRYVSFVDPSGGSADSFTMAIAHKDGETLILDAVRESRPPFSPSGVVQEFAALLRTYGIKSVTGDKYAGQFPRELFRSCGIQYDLSENTASEIYLNFLPLINSGRVELLDVPRLTSQLVGLERRTARSGKDSISHAPGAHDDIANAACGALLLAGVTNTARPSSMSYIPRMAR